MLRPSPFRVAWMFALFAACADAPTAAPLDESDENVRGEKPDEDDGDEPKRDAAKERPSTTRPSDAGKSDSRVADGAKAPDARAASPAGDAGAGGDKTGSDGLPCDIAAIVSEHCADCHGAKPQFGADFSLTSLASFQAVAADGKKKLYEVAHERINASEQRMPPASKPALPAAQLTKLSTWLKSGAKAQGELCPVNVSEKPTGDGGTDEGEYATPGSGGAHINPIKYDDPDLKCYPFTAFGKGARTKPYSVPTNPDYYVAFMMKAPWTGTQYIRSFRGIIDNKDVIHHWLFFKNLTPKTDGTIQENALGAHPDGEMLFGWAPGGDDMYLDPDVGFAVAGSDTFLLEAHYNNKTGGPAPDASGVEVCVTPSKPKNIAGLTWVGTDLINGTTATGVCSSTHTMPVRIFGAQPHMHTKGKHMKVVVNRKNGMQEVIHDEPFDFEYQRSYMLDVTLQPGDTMTTTCTFSSPARFGKGTSDEMCYFFTNSWPAGALTMPGIGTVIHGPNSCL
jgi:mono/diheme cytochrome c family protein